MARLAVSTGGTGGHIFPALAVAREARRRNADCRVLFLGGGGPEGDLARAEGLEFVELPARGVLGKGVKGLLSSVWVLRAVALARGALGRFRPEAVVGFGGYAGFCPVLAARLRGIPTAVHEQNSVPGATNRILGRWVRRVFLSFPDDRGAFPAHKCLLTGNPVRAEIFQAATRERAYASRRPNRLLVLGGSQGARAINEAVVAALPALKELGVEIIHQCGPTHEESIRAGYEAAGWNPSAVRGFMDDMAGAYAWADLAFCRSGASTVFEVAAAGLPAVFIPFPEATHGHQDRNAVAMEAAGAAQRIAQTGLNGSQVAVTVRTLFENPEKLARMAEAARGFARPDAAARIMDAVEEMIG
ncbi:MAG: undecaprenyldiphospho-muramoylpentapeptide beta-N-acetylglucosaminyltransferase [Desulfovibrionaceae bacterium]